MNKDYKTLPYEDTDFVTLVSKIKSVDGYKVENVALSSAFDPHLNAVRHYAIVTYKRLNND